MKSQYQNLQEQRNIDIQSTTANIKLAKPATEEALNQDNRICYKKRREELNKRVKSVIEQKQQTLNAKN